MLLPNTLLQNRYKIIELLGQGGMGAVYLAIDQRLGHQIALKQMFRAQNEVMAQAFEREARILARLNHRCLPKVSDHFSESDSRYLVMQYIDGIDLGELLEKNQRPFAPEQVLIWADSLLDTLEYLHHHEPPILHRDIKPQNLKINPRGELFLLDFGLAKDSATKFSSPLTTPSVIGYSLNYAPLEQIDRQGTTPETDVYSVCATLYHLLTNRLPADALERLCAKADAGGDPLIPANQLNPQVSAELAEALQRGMVLNRDRRLNATGLRNLLKNLGSLKTDQLPNEFLTAGNPLTATRTTAPELSNRISVPTLSPVMESSQNTGQPKTQAGLISNAAPDVAKPKRFFLPLMIGTFVLLLMGAGLGGAIIGYNQFVSAPTPMPAPPLVTDDNPVVKPTIESLAPPPANIGNQNIDESNKDPEKQSVPKTLPQKSTPLPKAPSTSKTTPPQKITPPTKNSGGSKKDKLPPIIIPQ